MSHSNQTPNIGLPLFIANDKPTWLSDWNGAMTTLDTDISGATGDATNALNTANQAIQKANSASSKADQAISTANTANNTAISIKTFAPYILVPNTSISAGSSSYNCNCTISTTLGLGQLWGEFNWTKDNAPLLNTVYGKSIGTFPMMFNKQNHLIASGYTNLILADGSNDVDFVNVTFQPNSNGTALDVNVFTGMYFANKDSAGVKIINIRIGRCFILNTQL